MRTNLSFSPLFRSTIGFDRVFDLLEQANRAQNGEAWPPYDIQRTSEDSYRVVMAVAGFSEGELTITHEPNLLIVAGNKPEAEGADYLHRGIPGRSFERRFELADHVQVTGADLKNGLLTVNLVREVPERLKPRKINVRAQDRVTGAEPTSGQRAA